MNKMKKLKHLNTFIVITAVIFFSSCENPKLKPPRENANQDNKEQPGVDGIDREFARELAREFGREFAIEFARQLKGSNNPVNFDFSKDSNNTQSIEGYIVKEGKVHPLLAHCSEDVLEFYQKHPDCFSILSTDSLPENLKWQDGSGEQEFASQNARRGGTWEVYMRDFPRTLRTIGPDANGAFRSYLLDYNVISLVHPHPNSDGYYPGLANSWAVGKDGRTVYFRLDPDAQYSDGKKVKVSDFFFFFIS